MPHLFSEPLYLRQQHQKFYFEKISLHYPEYRLHSCLPPMDSNQEQFHHRQTNHPHRYLNYWLNKEDPNYSLCRATENRGQDAHTDGKFDISDKGAMEIMKLFFTPNEDLQDKRITDFFDDEVFNSNFWLYWRTMFAFENWHSALEMKLYIQRYIHHIGGLPDFKALRFTKYNQYESMILPMIKYLESFGVQFHYGVQVVNVEFDCSD